MKKDDTIYALSSATGIAGVAVVRLSGEVAGKSLCALTARGLPQARRASLATLKDPDSGTVLDRCLVLWFPGPESFTGEDVVELHLHGGWAVIKGVLDTLARFDGLRAANAGEFTRRAVQHGRYDLVEAEGIGDLVSAETEHQRDQALRQAGGGLSGFLLGWQKRLTSVLAHLEAEIDFSEEELPGGLSERVRAQLVQLEEEISAVLGAGQFGEKLREGYLVAILGAPNVGKSSLLNALAGSDVAIVSSVAGTTRDVVQTRLVLDGVPVTFADTAGLREGGGEIEQEGMRRARAAGRQSDLRLFVFDAVDPDGVGGSDLGEGLGGEIVVVANKIDLVATNQQMAVGENVVLVSAKSGHGLDVLRRRVVEKLGWVAPRADEIVLTRSRHRYALEECRDSIERALGGCAGEIVAEDVRLAVRALGRVLGLVDVEDVLDVVFKDFCIGK